MNKTLQKRLIAGLMVFSLAMLYLLFDNETNNSKAEISLSQSLENTTTVLRMAKDYEFRIREDLIRHQMLIGMIEKDENLTQLPSLLRDSVSRSKKVLDQYSGLNIKNGVIVFDDNKTLN